MINYQDKKYFQKNPYYKGVLHLNNNINNNNNSSKGNNLYLNNSRNKINSIRLSSGNNSLVKGKNKSQEKFKYLKSNNQSNILL